MYRIYSKEDKDYLSGEFNSASEAKKYLYNFLIDQGALDIELDYFCIKKLKETIMQLKCKNCTEPTKIIGVSTNECGTWYTCDCCKSTFIKRSK